MQTGHELLLHGMKDMLDGERQLVHALQELAGDSKDPQLKHAFETHRNETQEQIQRLEQCFQLLGEETQTSECKGIRGLIEEKKQFSQENPSPDILDLFDVVAAIKTESYEISEYKALIQLAREMKHNKVVKLLNQNLKEEQATLKKMDGFSKTLKPESMMTEEQSRRAAESAGGGKRARVA
jgi:ferritin-like metal-binding protein YciE